jgi:hypothetical protein
MLPSIEQAFGWHHYKTFFVRQSTLTRTPDALVAVGDREPFGEGDGGVLAHRVRRVARIDRQARRRAGASTPLPKATPALEQNRSTCPNRSRDPATSPRTWSSSLTSQRQRLGTRRSVSAATS